jgi:hypothetical protein
VLYLKNTSPITCIKGVNSLMPIPSTVTFYNGIGKVNHVKLKEFLKEKEKEVVGWYSFRRNSVLSPHLREKLLHKELCSSLSHLSSEHFTMCLLNTSVSTQGSTHVFNHKFLRYRHRMFEALPVQIHNLGEAPQSEYKLVPSTACMSDSFNSIISSLRAGHERISDASLVCNIQRALQEHLQNLINDIEHSERRITELEKEVDALRLLQGPISNEILLPNILQEEIPSAGNISNSISSTNPSVSADNVVPAKVTKNQGSHNAGVESNRLKVSAKEEVVGDNSSDAFAFVTEMKIQMSQPKNATSPPPVELFSVSSNKHSGEHGRGIGRGIRRSQQSKNADVTDNSAKTRHSSQSQALDTASSTAVQGALLNMNNVNSKPRGYAQAVKKSGTSNSSVVTKSPAPSQVIPVKTTSTSGSPSNSNSQKF